MFADLTDKRIDEFSVKIICNLFRNRNLVDVDADLAGVAKLEKCDLSGGIANICIFPHDAPVAGLAAKF